MVIPTMLVPGAILMAVVIVFHFALITFGSPVMAPLGQGKGNSSAMIYKELFYRSIYFILFVPQLRYWRISVN